MSKRKKGLEGQLGRFIQQYRRKHAHHDPNDRAYDRKLEEKIKHMKPEELDELLRGMAEERDEG